MRPPPCCAGSTPPPQQGASWALWMSNLQSARGLQLAKAAAAAHLGALPNAAGVLLCALLGMPTVWVKSRQLSTCCSSPMNVGEGWMEHVQKSRIQEREQSRRTNSKQRLRWKDGDQGMGTGRRRRDTLSKFWWWCQEAPRVMHGSGSDGAGGGAWPGSASICQNLSDRLGGYLES